MGRWLRMVGVAGAAVCALALGACGGDDGEGDGDGAAGEAGGSRVVAQEAVVAAVKEKTGEQLGVEDPKPSLPWDRLDFVGKREGTTLTEEGKRLIEEYGAFTLYVIKEGQDYDARYELLVKESDSDTTDETVEPPDDEGIAWTETCFSAGDGPTRCSFSATKRYGENVVLRWQAGDEKQTTEGFERLDDAISGAVG